MDIGKLEKYKYNHNEEYPTPPRHQATHYFYPHLSRSILVRWGGNKRSKSCRVPHQAEHEYPLQKFARFYSKELFESIRRRSRFILISSRRILPDTLSCIQFVNPALSKQEWFAEGIQFIVAKMDDRPHHVQSDSKYSSLIYVFYNLFCMKSVECLGRVATCRPGWFRHNRWDDMIQLHEKMLAHMTCR